MDELKLSEKDMRLFNSKLGLKYLMRSKEVNIKRTLKKVLYESRLRKMQIQLIQMQNWIQKNNERVVVIFEGRDMAGKSGAIRRMTEHLNPRQYRVVALPKRTGSEQSQWYFQRYTAHLPKGGELVIFDRSWYDRAVIEPVNGYCSEEEYEIFMAQVALFERMLSESGIRLIKFYFSISKEEQIDRLERMKKDPRKKHKLTQDDEDAPQKWYEYTEYKERMFALSDTDENPWHIVQANSKMMARIKSIQFVLDKLPWKEKKKESEPESSERRLLN